MIERIKPRQMIHKLFLWVQYEIRFRRSKILGDRKKNANLIWIDYDCERNYIFDIYNRDRFQFLAIVNISFAVYLILVIFYKIKSKRNIFDRKNRNL